MGKSSFSHCLCVQATSISCHLWQRVRLPWQVGATEPSGNRPALVIWQVQNFRGVPQNFSEDDPGGWGRDVWTGVTGLTDADACSEALCLRGGLLGLLRKLLHAAEEGLPPGWCAGLLCVATCPSQERAPLYACACLLPIGAAPYERSSATRLAFDSHAWCAAQADRDFIDILARMRSGACSSEDLRELEARCSGSLDLSDGILPTMVRRCTPAVLQNLGHLIGPIPMCLWGGSRRRRGGTDCKGTPSTGASSSVATGSDSICVRTTHDEEAVQDEVEDQGIRSKGVSHANRCRMQGILRCTEPWHACSCTRTARMWSASMLSGLQSCREAACASRPQTPAAQRRCKPARCPAFVPVRPLLYACPCIRNSHML